MKIVFIIPSLRRGGVERVTTNIINSLDYNDYNVKLIICKGNSTYNEMSTLINDNVNILYLEKNSFRGALLNVFKILSSDKPDVVFTSFDHVSLPILFYKAVTFKKYKTVVRLNTLPSNKLVSNLRGRLYTYFFKHIISLSNVVIGQSEEMKEDIILSYKLPRNKVIAIRNIVDIPKVLKYGMLEVKEKYFSESVYTYIAAGSLGEVKGFDILIQAMAVNVAKGIKDVQLLIMGDNRESNDDYKSYLEKIIVDNKLESIVKLIGFKSNPYAYIQRSDAFVLSSRKEGFPNVVLESLILKKPCLVTNCVDFNGVISNGVNGIVVEKENVEALALGMCKIRELKDISESKFENFDYSKWFKSIIK